MATCALILAAGKGERFGREGGKLWTLVGGMPVLEWTLRAFQEHPEVEHLVLVGRGEELSHLRQVANHYRKIVAVVPGGAERWQSVQAGLDAVPPEDSWVLVHDGARAAVSADLISRVLRATRETGAAVPVLRVADTLKWVGSRQTVQATLPRRRREGDEEWQLMAVQTPQGFAVELLRRAYAQYDFENHPPTDDAMVVEPVHPVSVVPGDPQNLKLTYPEDLPQLEAALLGRGETRTGFGYDVHPFIEGRPLMLGGVQIPSPRGLAGHSDADVVLHAIIDALLGAAGMDDIGTLFPNTDPAYRNADSAQLLAQAWARVREQGWTLVNVDVTVLAETPRLRPHGPAMRERIAAVLQTE
ncbi:MAG: 2-C-methyl-D-erythritol 4-phosphate cytidylyltransferase, partial [Armatimonadota bacterium]|nr:2-C-methyl-D-erythritol 4-phosphate cytidylyltransferase [Armatimonadota bacterium]